MASGGCATNTLPRTFFGKNKNYLRDLMHPAKIKQTTPIEKAFDRTVGARPQ